MSTADTPTPPHTTLVMVEANRGGDPLLDAVRAALAHLPVRVIAITRTAPTIQGAPRV